MIKRISVYSLPEGSDPEEFWKYHKEVHAPDIKNGAGSRLKKYVIHRITKVIDGKANFYGFVETWWDNEGDVEKGFGGGFLKTPSGKNPHEDFLSRVTDFFHAEVEEKVIIP